jgi:hypothetical protein
MLWQSCGILWAGPVCSTTKIQYWRFFPNSQKMIMLTDTVFSISHFLAISYIKAMCLTRFQQIPFVAIVSLLKTDKYNISPCSLLYIVAEWLYMIWRPHNENIQWSLLGLSTVSISSWRSICQRLPLSPFSVVDVMSAVFARYIETPNSHLSQLRLYVEQWTVSGSRWCLCWTRTSLTI